MGLNVCFREDIAQSAAGTLASFIAGQVTSGSPNASLVSVAILVLSSHVAIHGVKKTALTTMTRDILEDDPISRRLLDSCIGTVALPH